jgi:hypothetical protein
LASCNPKYEGGIEQSAPTDNAVCWNGKIEYHAGTSSIF